MIILVMLVKVPGMAWALDDTPSRAIPGQTFLSQAGQDGTLHVPAFALPVSSLLTEETRAVLRRTDDFDTDFAASLKACPAIESESRSNFPAIRQCEAQAFYGSPFYKRVRARYAVVIASQRMGGVDTEVFTPTLGISRKNQNRVLVNLHGGGFETGSRTFSQVESMPIAAIGRIKVISVDYRLAPENVFPAATEDAVTVYRELLKAYPPRNIGIYGCSAGGTLTAEVVAWLLKAHLPLPGAVGMFCGAGSDWWAGDSGHFVAAFLGDSVLSSQEMRYFKGSAPQDPLVNPMASDALMRRFPPSLLISSIRDQALSSVVTMHSRLVALGVDAHLHVWEGLMHTFYFDPDLPESREVHDVVIRFFDKQLGRQSKAADP